MRKTNLDSKKREKPWDRVWEHKLDEVDKAHSKTLNTMRSKNIIIEKRGKGLGINRLSTESPGSHRVRNSLVSDNVQGNTVYCAESYNT